MRGVGSGLAWRQARAPTASRTVGEMLDNVAVVAKEVLRRHKQIEVNSTEEFDFQIVYLVHGDPSHFGIKGIGEVHVIEVLGSKH